MSQEQLAPTPDQITEATVLIEFQYKEMKELAVQFLTVLVGMLALSVTFGEKIINFSEIKVFAKVCLITSWGTGLVAFMLGGAAIFCTYNAGIEAKFTIAENKLYPFIWWRDLAHKCLFFAGVCFVAALIFLVLTGLAKLIR